MLAALVIAPPILRARGYAAGAAVIHLLYAPVCHQNPGRSFELAGTKLPVCQRCSGIYFGLLAGTLAPAGLVAALRRRSRAWALAAVTPMLLDAGVGALGIWSGQPQLRIATGLLFGVGLGAFASAAVAELCARSDRTSEARTEVRLTPGGVLHE